MRRISGRQDGTAGTNTWPNVDRSRWTALAFLLATVALAGPVAADATPGKVNFGSQPLNTTSAAKAVTVRCPQSVSVIFDDLQGRRHRVESCTVIDIQGGGSGDFAVDVPGGCATTFGPGETCEMNATFTPSGCGERTGTVTVILRAVIDATHSAREDYTVVLRGRGAC